MSFGVCVSHALWEVTDSLGLPNTQLLTEHSENPQQTQKKGQMKLWKKVGELY